MSIRFTLVLLLSLVTRPTLAAEAWASFQNGGRLSFGDEINPPVELDGKQSWSVALAGYGQSSPVIFDDTIYVTSVAGEEKQSLIIQAFQRSSGQELWRHTADNGSPEESTNYVSRAAPTPVCDSDGVIAFFEGGNIVALDPQGKLRWERDLAADFGPIQPRHGIAASLEQSQQRIFVSVERGDDSYVLALAKDSGKTIWKAAGLDVTSWSRPRLIRVDAGNQLVINGIGKRAGFDPETGRRLGDFDDVSGNSTPTPVPAGTNRFVLGATVGRGSSRGGQAAESNGLIEISRDEAGMYHAEYVWRAERATSSFGSPLVHNHNAYFVNRSGVVYCLDLETGKEHFAKRAGESNWATPLGVANRIYLFGKDGVMTVISAGTTFQQLSTSRVWSSDRGERESGESDQPAGTTLYGVAAIENDLVFRRGDRLFKASR